MYDFIKDYNEKELTYALYGLFLGDGWYASGKLRTAHTDRQKFYIEWLEKVFIGTVLAPKTKYNRIKKTTFGDYSYNYLTLTVPKRFYFETNEKCYDKNNKKIVSDYVLNNINPLGILFWFLDDGQFHVSTKNNKTSRFGYLNTQSFSLEDNKRIQAMFKNRFDIDLRIHKDSSPLSKCKDKIYYRLYFNAKNFRKLYDLVREFLPYIPEQFHYKFNMKYVPNRIKANEEFSKKYNL